ncbi:anthranilate synthase component I family protein [Paenibacillus sp. J2TS4]|uniref:anthranilate synthase component I family protein n=1 Tax=Paenibacillus sp. J2TS4 TaxID=2807194 RepID=UPI001B11C7BD|nr:anthranilate synthase component I family protein [Paenibacillus sp. J2TS4]GIP36361.1 para-aminobenzoate synthase [Paenibacillus sp. J2TS4]
METITTLDHWLEWASSGRYSLLPYVRKYALPPGSERLISWEQAWKHESPSSFVLESGKGGRYTFLGLSPKSMIEGKGEEGVVTVFASGERQRRTGKPLALIKEWMQPHRAPAVLGAPKFIGGCVGFLGYDVARSIEKLPVTAYDDLSVPDYVMTLYDELWIMDHELHELYCAVHIRLEDRNGSTADQLAELYEQAERKIESMKCQWDRIASVQMDEEWRAEHSRRIRRLEQESLHIDVASIQGLRPALQENEFIEAVRRIQSYIAQGDVFQVNLSVRQSKKLEARPEAIYEWLRLVNPSPYMGLLRYPGFQLVSGSPELLVQLEANQVRTRPIAGTRPRGMDQQEDLRLADELIHNDKERAEHVMLVDLLRNDLGRISSYGSVRVDDFMVVETYSHVMHIVSEVKGELAQGKDVYDVIAAVFPGGTITGAPKIRTMEIIEGLEPVRRGPYTGSIGWIDYTGNMELNIVIRTLLVTDGVGHVQAGAGIVIDSAADREYIESLNKAKALWKSIELSEQCEWDAARAAGAEHKGD